MQLSRMAVLVSLAAAAFATVSTPVDAFHSLRSASMRCTIASNVACNVCFDACTAGRSNCDQMIKKYKAPNCNKAVNQCNAACELDPCCVLA